MSTKQRRWAERNPERVRKYNRAAQRRHHLKSKYGITPEQYDALLDAQQGVCAVCRRPETKHNQHGPCRLAVDHCHSTGRVRGLLCSECNTALGKLGDDPVRLRRALDYLVAES